MKKFACSIFFATLFLVGCGSTTASPYPIAQVSTTPEPSAATPSSPTETRTPTLQATPSVSATLTPKVSSLLHVLGGTITGLDAGAHANLRLDLIETGDFSELWHKVWPGMLPPYPEHGNPVARFSVTNGRWQATDLSLPSGLYMLAPEADGYVSIRKSLFLVLPGEGVSFRYTDLNFQFLHPADARALFGIPLCATPPPYGGEYVVPTAVPTGTPTFLPLPILGTIFPTPPWPPGSCYAGHFWSISEPPSGLLGSVSGLKPGETAKITIYAVPPFPNEVYSDIPIPPGGKAVYATGKGPLAVIPTLAPNSILTATMTVGNGPWGLIDPNLGVHKFVVIAQGSGETLWPKSYEIVLMGGKFLGLSSGLDFGVGTPRFSMTPVPTPTPFVMPPLRVEQMTLDQAKQVAGFHISAPGYLPAGFRLRSVTRMGDDFGLDYGGPSPSGRAGELGFLSIDERFLPAVALPPGITLPPTPDFPRETALVHNQRALVVRSFPPPAWFTPEPGNPSSYPSLEWGEDSVYFLVGGSLSLDELVKIANSLQ